MKKLNNHGWSLREMIFILCGLFIALAIAIYYINILYGIYEKNDEEAKIHKIEAEKKQEKKESQTTQKETTTTTEAKTAVTNYTILEKKLSQSALNYVVDLNSEFVDDFTITITFTELKTNNYLDNLIEEEGKSECDGYAIVYAKDDQLYSDPYITCSNYQTANFESWRIN